MNNKTILWIWTKLAVNDSSVKLSKLYKKYKDVEAIYNLSQQEIIECSFLDDDSKARLMTKSLDKAEKLKAECDVRNIKIITIDDENYPTLLRDIPIPPCLLFCFGNYDKAFSKPRITIVGTRKATTYGETCTRSISSALSMCGLTIVTGIAEGIDTQAATGAIKANGSVIAVLPCGFFALSKKTKRMLNKYVLNGVLITEHLPDTPSPKYAYQERNRILSGLSEVTFVTQAPEQSGALITANHALEQGREIFVLPANIDLTASKGSNALLRDGATPVFDFKDILKYFLPRYSEFINENACTDTSIVYKHRDKADNDIDSSINLSDLTEMEKAVLKQIYNGKRTNNAIANELNITAISEILVSVTSLEIKGLIKIIDSEYYISNE